MASCLNARCKRSSQLSPRKSALYGTRTRLTCSTGRPPLPLRHRAKKCPAGVAPAYPPWQGGASAARPRTHFKDGRIRTLSARFGGALLSQEHVLNCRSKIDADAEAPRRLVLLACICKRVPGVGIEPTPTGSEPVALPVRRPRNRPVAGEGVEPSRLAGASV